MQTKFLLSPSELKLLKETLDRHELPSESNPYHRFYFRAKYNGVSGTSEQIKKSHKQSVALHSLYDSLGKRGFRKIRTPNNHYYSDGFVIVKTLDEHFILKIHESEEKIANAIARK